MSRLSGVRSIEGAPTLEDFVGSDGSPIFVDMTPGSEKLYVVNANNEIVVVTEVVSTLISRITTLETTGAPALWQA